MSIRLLQPGTCTLKPHNSGYCLCQVPSRHTRRVFIRMPICEYAYTAYQGVQCMLYAKKSVAMDWTKVSSMGQNCILPFGWDNFVPAIMFWDKLNSRSMPRLITRKPTYKWRARNRHLHNCGNTIISTFLVNG